ncbi:MAG TPA: hypothetical protein VGN97_02415 [Mesorhizobium sp.]|jgi:hypothetical protein|nr:hypothetical protein [Mesorhizobium sp.]
MRLYHLCREFEQGSPMERGPIVLVVARSADDARRSLRTALDSGAEPSASVEQWSADDLGPHDGPEPAGSVFLDGQSVATTQMH